MSYHGGSGRRKFFIFILTFFLSLAVILSAAFLFFGKTDEMVRFKDLLGFKQSKTIEPAVTVTPEPTPVKAETKYAVLTAVGDILIHSPILTAQYRPATDDFDFNNNYKFVKKYITDSDLALANFETSLGGGDSSTYSGYPSFNSPDSLAAALKNAGFDMLSTSNNHIYDSGEEGFFRTGSKLRELGFDVIGTRTDPVQKNYTIKEVNGIKIGFANFGFDTGAYGTARSLNGIPLTDRVTALVDTFGYDTLEEDLPKIRKTIQDMKTSGAELTVIVMHWGNEYETSENEYETMIAGKLADYGADVILGGHPHVLQPIKTVKSAVTGKTTLVVYSTGNFISNQRAELMEIDNPTYPEDGMIVYVRVKKDGQTGAVGVSNVGYLPTWVHKYYTNGLQTYEILPVRDAIADPAGYNLGASSDAVPRIQRALQNTLGIMATDPGQSDRPFKILEYPDYLNDIKIK